MTDDGKPVMCEDLVSLLHEPHRLGFVVSGKTGTYDMASVLVKRDWYERLIAFGEDHPATPAASGPFWLIERGQPPEWYGSYATGRNPWTTDATNAVRFGSRAEAEAFIDTQTTGGRPTQHTWLPAASGEAALAMKAFSPIGSERRLVVFLDDALAAIRAESGGLDERSSEMRWRALEAVRTLVGDHVIHRPRRDDCAVCRFFIADARLAEADHA